VSKVEAIIRRTDGAKSTQLSRQYYGLL